MESQINADKSCDVNDTEIKIGICLGSVTETKDQQK